MTNDFSSERVYVDRNDGYTIRCNMCTDLHFLKYRTLDVE
jgi:hypothetical protein